MEFDHALYQIVSYCTVSYTCVKKLFNELWGSIVVE